MISDRGDGDPSAIRNPRSSDPGWSFVMSVEVGPEAIDEMGHANNVETVRWIERAGRAHLAAVGFPLERLFETGGAFVARRHEIDYLRPTFLGDRLTVRTRVASMGGARSVREVGIYRNEEAVARARTEWVFVDLKTGHPRRVAPEILQAFRELGDEGDRSGEAAGFPNVLTP